jgi:hypothetical protein
MNQHIRLAVFLLSAGGFSCACSQMAVPSASVSYYPLAKGYSWKYEVHVSGKSKTSVVEWRVTGADKSKNVFQVWQFPSQSDDVAMSLHLSTQGIVEESTGALILKLPAQAGDSWSATRPAHRVFRIISSGKPCQVGTIGSDDCVVVEDDQDSLKFRTVTTYAKGIGPVLYAYYKKGTTSHTPIQIVELVSYHLDTK